MEYICIQNVLKKNWNTLFNMERQGNATESSPRQHVSWSGGSQLKSPKDILESILKKQKSVQSIRDHYPHFTFQENVVPVLDVKYIDDPHIQTQVYDLFFDHVGCIIIKGVFQPSTMQSLNQWTESFIEEAKRDSNCVHPKQKDKYLVNDVVHRMARSNPKLLLDTVFSNQLLKVLDTLLGYARVGSATMHWIQPGGSKQIAHVDYPIHVGSGAYWEGKVQKVKDTMTRYQINKMMPYYSVQSLIAADKMNKTNGSTEFVPCSQCVDDMDIHVHDAKVKGILEPYFVNASLEQGDVLVFNRRLCHRGGENKSRLRRNALIIQSVFSWGIGQEIIQADKVLGHLKDTICNSQDHSVDLFSYKALHSRMSAPYPIDVKKCT